MDTHQHLINLIIQRVQLSDEERDQCCLYFEPLKASKHQLLEEEGKVPQYLYYIVSGYLRLFHFDAEGNEVTTHINCPPGFITAYTYFSEGTVSPENLECVTDCSLLRITKTALGELIAKSNGFKDFSFWVFQKAIAYNEARARDLTLLTAEERYVQLLKTKPDILQQVPLQYIASFLGMNPKSLSRIRRQWIK